MLIGIPKNISPELLKVLSEMGHGDEILLADGNYPAAAHAQLLVRADGLGVPELLESILSLFPLDPMVECPVVLTQYPAGQEEPEVWATYHAIVEEKAGEVGFELLDAPDFYARAKKCYAIVATGEGATYANIILRKGIVG